MIHLQVSYKIRTSQVAEAEGKIAAFVNALRASERRFVAYQILRYGHDNSSYIHEIRFPDHEAQQKHTDSIHVKTFVEEMVGLCEVGPVYNEMESIAAIGTS